MKNQNEEFRLLLKSLHLEMKQLADFWGISLRSVQRWAGGEEPVPTSRLASLKSWQAWSEDMAQSLLSRVMNDYATHGTPKAICLLVYHQADYAELVTADLPCQVHASAIGRVQFLLESQGFKVNIIRFNRQAYDEWRGDRTDASDVRSEWASCQIK